MRLSGGILILLSVMFSGVAVSSRLKKRSVFLGETVMLISRVSMEIEYINLPLFDIFEKITQSDCCRSLDFLTACLELWNKGEDFFYSWEKGLEQSRLPLKGEERQRLKNLGAMLGTSDAAGQKAMLALYKGYFTLYHTKALEEYEKYGKMSVTLGVVVGAGIFIMLM